MALDLIILVLFRLITSIWFNLSLGGKDLLFVGGLRKQKIWDFDVQMNNGRLDIIVWWWGVKEEEIWKIVKMLTGRFFKDANS